MLIYLLKGININTCSRNFWSIVLYFSIMAVALLRSDTHTVPIPLFLRLMTSQAQCLRKCQTFPDSSWGIWPTICSPSFMLTGSKHCTCHEIVHLLFEYQVIAAATIQGRCLFRLTLLELWLQFEGGHYSRAVFNRRNTMKTDDVRTSVMVYHEHCILVWQKLDILVCLH